MTTKRRTANVACQKPLTSIEGLGYILPPAIERGKPICCIKCKQPGGTLVKTGLDKNNKQLYTHMGC